MKLDISNWKEFRFGNLITDKNIYKAKALNKDELFQTTELSKGIRYITRTGENNGCEMLALLSEIDSAYIEEKNAITIGDTTATCFYQAEKFITGDHMVVIRADWLNETRALYILTILNNEKYKYSYGRAFLIDRIKDTIIKLPAIKSGDEYVPNWVQMEEYIHSLYYKPLTTTNNSIHTKDLNINDWKEFEIGRFFTIKPTKNYAGLSNNDLNDGGETPFVVNSAENNGIGGFSSLTPTEKKGIITFSDTTDSNTFFYQPDDFIGFAHIQGMYPKHDVWTKASMLFLTTILQFSNRGLFNYGRKMRRDIIGATVVRLPIKHNIDSTPLVDDNHIYSDEGYVPDWEYMEEYMKSLPYGDRM